MKNLTPYAVESRYPGDFFYEYPVEEAREAIRIAKYVKEFVQGKLPVNSLKVEEDEKLQDS